MTATLDPRTRLLLEAPIAPTLLRLGAPNVLVMLAQAGVGLIETYFVGKLGTDALAGMARVFPAVMLMQMTLLIRPCEVLSRVANVTILEVANNALRVLLQHRHVIIGSLA